MSPDLAAGAARRRRTEACQPAAGAASQRTQRRRVHLTHLERARQQIVDRHTGHSGGGQAWVVAEGCPAPRAPLAPLAPRISLLIPPPLARCPPAHRRRRAVAAARQADRHRREIVEPRQQGRGTRRQVERCQQVASSGAARDGSRATGRGCGEEPCSHEDGGAAKNGRQRRSARRPAGQQRESSGRRRAARSWDRERAEVPASNRG